MVFYSMQVLNMRVPLICRVTSVIENNEEKKLYPLMSMYRIITACYTLGASTT